MIVLEPQVVLCEAVERALGIQLLGERTAIGVAGDDGIRGVLAFDKISSTDCEMHAAGQRGFITRGLLRAAGRWMFEGWEVGRVTIRIPERNTYLIEIAERFGFKPEGRQRKLYGTDDAVVLGLLASEFSYVAQQTAHRSAA